MRGARTPFLLAAVALAALLDVEDAAAQQAPSRVGRRYVKRPVASDVGGLRPRPVFDPSFIVFRIVQDEDGWLWGRGEGMHLGVTDFFDPATLIPFEDAAEYFTARIKDDPNEAGWYIMRGLVRTEKEYDLALADFDDAIRLDPKEAAAYVDRGSVREAKGDLDRALQDLDEAIRLRPKLVHAYSRRASIRQKKGDHDRAIADDDEAIRLDPRFVEAYGHRGFCRYDRGDYDRAVADFTEAIRLAPDDARGYIMRARVLFLRRDYARALADANEAILLDPRDFHSLNIRARIWAACPDPALRDGPRAVASASRANDLAGWSDPYLLSALAGAYAESGDFAAAVQWEERALLLQKDDAERRLQAERLDLYKARKPYRMAAKAEDATPNP